MLQVENVSTKKLHLAFTTRSLSVKTCCMNIFPLVNQSFFITLFLDQAFDFPLAQHIDKGLDIERRWGRRVCFLFLKRRSKNSVEYSQKKCPIYRVAPCAFPVFTVCDGVKGLQCNNLFRLIIQPR